MDAKEAIEYLKNERGLRASFSNVSNMTRAFVNEAAIKALEKQIPRKPIDKTKPDDTASRAYENCNIIVCPTCSGRLKLKSKGKYCDKCGQKLDWSEQDVGNNI